MCSGEDGEPGAREIMLRLYPISPGRTVRVLELNATVGWA